MPVLVWFRLDLRLQDNPALHAAVSSGEEIVPLYIHSPTDEGDWPIGGASKWWLHYSLSSLAADLKRRGAALVIKSGPAAKVLREIAAETCATAIYWNRRYEPALTKRDAEIKESFKKAGIECHSTNSALLREPWDGCKADNTPYLVYTPFQNNYQSKGFGREPLPAPESIRSAKKRVSGETLDSLKLLPSLPWAARFPEFWSPGEAGAHAALDRFLEEAASDYGKGRDLPAAAGTSRLSPRLHFGELSPDQVVAAVRAKFSGKRLPDDAAIYVKEIIWREFAHHLLYHFPETPTEPLRKEFRHFPWERNPDGLRAWQKGETGYPIVDAGMRELWATGWMHNRVRMIAASFLVKDLLIPWQEGAKWFWDTLVDADLASNTLGWQWTSGCGADAAPYFRVFNPTLQGEKFDPQGEYVKRWCPELKSLPPKWIHKPWEAPAKVLASADVTLGKSYPLPIVDHVEAREAALSAYDDLREERAKA